MASAAVDIQQLTPVAYLQEFLNHTPANKYNLYGSKSLIGRNQNAEVPIIASNVSRNHAFIELSRRREWCITDNRSINGVYLNGKKLEPAVSHPLKHRSKIYLGPPEMTERHFEFFEIVKTERQPLSQTATQIDLARPGCSTSSQSTNFGNKNDRRSLRKRVLRSQTEPAEEKKDIISSSSDSSLEERISAVDSILRKNDAIDERIKRILNQSDERLSGAHDSFKECSTSLLSKANLDVDLISWSDWSGDDNTQNVPLRVSPSERNNRKKRISSGSDNTISGSQPCSMSNEELQTLREKVAQLEKELKDRDVAKVDLEEQLKAKESLLEKQKNEKKIPEEHAKAVVSPTKTLQEKVNSEIANQFGQILESELTCVICTELFIKATTLECSHTFCKDCLATWKQSKKVCPICRTAIKGETHSLVIDGFIEKLVEKLGPEDQAKRKQVLLDRVKPIIVVQKNTRRPRARRGRFRSRQPVRAPTPPVIEIPDIEIPPIDHQYTDLDIEIDPIEIMLGFRDSDIFSNISVHGSSDDSDVSSIDGISEAYYGGYGRCYNCGRSGHWANGCPEF